LSKNSLRSIDFISEEKPNEEMGNTFSLLTPLN